MNNPVLDKIESIKKSGEEAYKTGTVKVFTGFPESLKNRFNVALAGHLMQWAVHHDSFERLVVSLDNQFRLKGYFVVMDYPLHSTMLEGVWEGPETEKGAVFSRVREDVSSAIKSVAFEKVVAYSDLVLDANGTLLLMAKEIPESILALRERLAEIYTQHGLKALSLENMLHATLHRAKVLTLDSENQYYSMGKYYEEVRKYDSTYGPLGAFNMKIEGFYVGPVWELLHAGVSRKTEVSVVR